jgi:hypothetical protein
VSILKAGQGRATRRSRIYSGRIRRSIFGFGLQHPCIFLHLPKCGGTSLSEALYATVPMHKRVGVIDAVSTRRAASILEFGIDDAWKCHDDLEFGDRTFDLREGQLITHCCWNTQLVHGHVLLTDRIRTQFHGRYKFLTIMRDPVERTISNYRMAVAAGIADPDPEVWLASPIARAHSTTYLRYLSGHHAVTPDQEAHCLEMALAAVDLFSLIGFLDDIDAFTRDFEQQFGARLVLHKYNQAKGGEARLSGAQMARLRDMCVADRAIYDRARASGGHARVAA